MADLCLPLSAGEDTFELHSVQLELEAVEKQIDELLERQAQLRERQTALETSRADAHRSGVSIHLHLVIWQTLLSKAIHKEIHLEEAIRQRKCS